MKFWQALSFTEVDQLVELAPLCEEVGFHGVFLADHVAIPEKIESRYLYAEDGAAPFDGSTQFPEPWATIAAMSAVTRTLRFGTTIYIAPLHHPLVVAKAVSTAAVLSGGRVALGVGAGWLKEEFEILGEDFHTRGRRLDEILDVCRKLWAGGMVEHRGEFYAFPRVQQAPAPLADVPIWVGGASEPALRRAARNDGWLSTGNLPGDVPGILERLRHHRAEAGRQGDFEIVMALGVPPDPALYRELEGQGVTGMINYPLAYAIGPGTSVDEKRRALEQYGNEIIARC